MRRRKKTTWMVAAMLIISTMGMHASAATGGIGGTRDSAALARLDRDATVASAPNEMATPAAAFVAFLVGYIAADVINHLFGRYSTLRVPVGADEGLFDF